jgi:hypothetical protein
LCNAIVNKNPRLLVGARNFAADIWKPLRAEGKRGKS